MTRLFILGVAMAGQAMAESFLARSPVELSQEDVMQLLLSELQGTKGAERLQRIEMELDPMFRALPKNGQDRLDMATVRYALHRYFLHQYGWYVKGLEKDTAAWTSAGATTLLKARAPSFLQSLFE